jgi:hypothetical protein
LEFPASSPWNSSSVVGIGRKIEKLQTFLSAFSIVWPDAAEFAQAYELLAEHRLTSGLGIPDCLVAARSLTRKARLYTFNLKHFQVISGIDVQEPYSRQ